MSKHWVCKKCGGTKLLFDARSVWSSQQQTFVLVETFPGDWTYCSSCEDVVDVKEIENAEPVEATGIQLVLKQYQSLYIAAKKDNAHISQDNFIEVYEELSKYQAKVELMELGL